MKKFFSIALVASAAALFVASCQRIEFEKPIESKTGDEVTIIINARKAGDTKTIIDGTTVKWAETGEYLQVFEVANPSEGDPTTTAKQSAQGGTTDSGATMTFGVSFTTGSASTYDYYAIYPSVAYNKPSSGSPNVNSIQINTKAAQTPKDSGFDPEADLLLAEPQTGKTTQPTSLQMKFGRVVAVGKITIKNLGSTDPVTKITFSAKQGENNVVLAGRTAYNLTDQTLVNTYGGNVAENSIILDCSYLTKRTANTAEGMSAFFTCYPFALNATNPGTISVVVETATQRFTKANIPVNTEKGLAFKNGTASEFAINMDGIAGEDKAFEGCYAYLDYADFTGAGGIESYGNVTVNKTHGDSWVMYAVGTNNAIGVRRNDKTDNDSYIKLPDFKDVDNHRIETVVVTLKNVQDSKQITLESSQTATGGTIASLTTSTGTTVYTFDLSSSPKTTAYFRSTDAQAQVEKIEVYAGTDTRSAFAAPSTVSAVLNTADTDVTNSIDVTWSLVDGASGYVITLTPDSGDDVVVKASSSPYTVTDLAYEMEYAVAVQAEPADYYVNKISAQTTASDVVTTGAAANGAVTLTASDITTGSNAVQISVNGLLGYRLGTSSNAGSITIKANDYATVSFKAVAWNNKSDSFSITNGTVNGNASVSPLSNTAAQGTINANDSVTINDNYSEITIDVTDPSADVVITSNKRVILWGFTAVSATAPAVAAPTFSVAEGTYNTAQSVTIACATAGATIHYTTDGLDPTSSSTTYSGAINVNVTTTLKAIAIKGSDESAIASATYTLKVAAPTFSVAGGIYSDAQSVEISCTTDGATIYYTTDGTDPASSSTTYGGAISISETKTIRAIAVKADWTNSDEASATYTIGSASPSDQSANYTGNISVGTSNRVTIGSTDYYAQKAGTGKVAGSVTLTIPSGTKYLHLHAAAWNNENVTLSVSPAGYSSDISLTADSGVSGSNSTYDVDDSKCTTDYYKVITFTNALENATDLTFTATGGNRFVIWGVYAE